jgi:thioesterase domain-containing protein
MLGGYSGGGVVALEIARKAAEAGERTSAIALFDTFHPGMAAREIGWRDHVNAIATDGIGYVFRNTKGKIVRHFNESRQARRLGYYLRRDAQVPHELREWHVSTAFVEALRHHVPTRYTGDVTLFRASDTARVYDHAGPRLGWDPSVLPALEVVVVPGGHHSLVDEPNVRLLAARLDRMFSRGAIGSHEP